MEIALPKTRHKGAGEELEDMKVRTSVTRKE